MNMTIIEPSVKTWYLPVSVGG